MASERIRLQIHHLLDEAREATAASQWELVRDLSRAVLALDDGNADARAFVVQAETELATQTQPRPAEPPKKAPASAPEAGSVASPSPLDPLTRRIANIRFAVAVVLAGFLLNAGFVVLIVASVGGSVVVSLATLGVMAGVILVAALYNEFFTLRASGARPLLPGDFPWLEPMVGELAQQAGIPRPRVLVSPFDSLNAYTTGSGANAKIVFYSALLHQLSRDEVRAVAAHELGHVLNRDISLAVWTGAVFWWVLTVRLLALMAAYSLVGFVKGCFESSDPWGPVVGLFAGIFLLPLAALIWVGAQAWTTFAKLLELAVNRQREYLADATAVVLTGQPAVFASALARIADDPSIPRGAQTVGRFCIVSPFFGGGWWEDLTSTHPPYGRRIEEVLRLPEQPGRSLSGAEWKGIGSTSMFLPAGAVAALALLALMIPLFSDGGGGATSFRSSGQARSSSVRSDVLPVTSVPRATTAPAPSPTATTVPTSPIQYGQSVQGSIGVEEETDNWAFEGRAADVVTIRLTQDGPGSYGPTVRLLEPGGTQVKSESRCDGQSPREAMLLNEKLTSSGRFVIRVQACGSTTGAYRLALSLKPPPETIPFGSQKTGSIVIPNDYQEWRFSANAGDIVTILMVKEGGASGRPVFALFDESGEKVKNGDFGGHPCDVAESRLLNFKLAFSGTYTIRASHNCGAVGGYRLTLLLKPPPGVITYGQERTSTLDIRNDYHDWQFVGNAGDVITLRLLQEGGASGRLRFDLIDPSGEKIAQGDWVGHPCDGPSAKLENFRLPFSGTYTVRVTSNCDTVGGYRLILTGP